MAIISERLGIFFFESELIKQAKTRNIDPSVYISPMVQAFEKQFTQSTQYRIIEAVLELVEEGCETFDTLSLSLVLQQEGARKLTKKAIDKTLAHLVEIGFLQEFFRRHSETSEILATYKVISKTYDTTNISIQSWGKEDGNVPF